jgi:hypothetical protein
MVIASPRRGLREVPHAHLIAIALRPACFADPGERGRKVARAQAGLPAFPICHKGDAMLTRTALVVGLAGLLAQTPQATAHRLDHCGAPVPLGFAQGGGVCRPLTPIALGEHTPSDIVRGSHARLLRQIAIYASLGNHAGVEMLTAKLRARGVNTEAVRAAVTWEVLHGSPPAPLAVVTSSPRP